MKEAGLGFKWYTGHLGFNLLSNKLWWNWLRVSCTFRQVEAGVFLREATVQLGPKPYVGTNPLVSLWFLSRFSCSC